ncbi:MAG: prepilin-type N-terminal cleavage/methylation domain-containing protein [Kofleriaceae bacterium]|nr:prepilin-type N-terminal cleavage/methylation domain-containing protein [Myxococcales bacterium]MCB9560960.1 prepilin-type N-terminal cleavage/methylation domain-containing protein [Kofleriaceae bacterium]MCB9575000.1 prepilin-type N-terminal cleavage/methylation domain-containing protein [Kofleriaceae bacterium]
MSRVAATAAADARRAAGRGQAGMTLIEVLVASAILAVMLSLAWTTTSRTSDVKRTYEAVEERAQEMRVGLARVVDDLEHAYLSKNEDTGAFDRRTMFTGKDGGNVDELRFTSLCHQVLWSEANESDQTMISYFAGPDRDDRNKVDWLRREQRRLTDAGESYKSMSAETDVVLRDIEQVDFAYWDWKDNEWKSDWDSTKQDAQKDRLPTRVKITVKWREAGQVVEMSTQARLLLQEPLESRFGTEYERAQ